MNGKDVKYWIYVLEHVPTGTVPVVLGIAIAIGTWAVSRKMRDGHEANLLRTFGYILAAMLTAFGAIMLVLAFGGCC